MLQIRETKCIRHSLVFWIPAFGDFQKGVQAGGWGKFLSVILTSKARKDLPKAAIGGEILRVAIATLRMTARGSALAKSNVADFLEAPLRGNDKKEALFSVIGIMECERLLQDIQAGRQTPILWDEVKKQL